MNIGKNIFAHKLFLFYFCVCCNKERTHRATGKSEFVEWIGMADPAKDNPSRCILSDRALQETKKAQSQIGL